MDNPSLFEEIYRVVVKQLLERGWPIECEIITRKGTPWEDESDCFFVVGPYIPYYQRDMGFESLFAYIQKDGKISRWMNEDELIYFNNPSIIYIDKDDIDYLKLVPNEKVIVWFFHGNI